MPAASDNKRVLVAPLDWGLGHASRCIPLIRRIRAHGATVVIAAQGPTARFLGDVFPDCEIVPVCNYDIRYTPHPMTLMLKFPFMVARVYRRAAREHRELNAIIGTHKIDAVVADQRFGFWSRQVPSVFISHQLCVKMPRIFAWLEYLVWRKLKHAAEAFSELWIPDYEGDGNLTGELTRKYPLPGRSRFIGPLSRFEGIERAGGATARDKLDLLVMVSGPEPQRTRFENIVEKQLQGYSGSAVVLCGIPGHAARNIVGPSVRFLPHASAEETAGLLSRAGAVVCRGGYTTMMELVQMKKKAVLVPTPGQTEQEYLCARASRMGWFIARAQATFDLRESVQALGRFEPSPLPPSGSDLCAGAVADLLARAAACGGTAAGASRALR